MAQYKRLDIGDPAPLFRQRSTSDPDYIFDSVAGRYLVLCFYATAADVGGRNMLRILEEHRALFDDSRVAFFGVSLDPADEAEGRVRAQLPGIRFFWDFDYKISRLYGAAPLDAEGQCLTVRRLWLVLDPMLRVLSIFNGREDGAERHDVAAFLRGLPPVAEFAGFPMPVPVIVLTDVFEPDLCTRLIEVYEAQGGEESSFMRDIGGRTVPVMDFSHKQRYDATVENEALRGEIQSRVLRRVAPEIKKVHQFDVTRMERYIVGCYDGATGGHFQPHRDNTTKGTAHRRFALSIGLNDDFEGGELVFPEYGHQGFRIGRGVAVVFSCSLLHAVSPVTTGKRFAFLPFLYDDEAARIRVANNPHLDESVGEYTFRERPEQT